MKKEVKEALAPILDKIPDKCSNPNNPNCQGEVNWTINRDGPKIAYHVICLDCRWSDFGTIRIEKISK